MVDIVLFPLDTVKTRLQSKIGFWAAGGFRSIYAGIVPAAVGSAPSGEWITLFSHCNIFDVLILQLPHFFALTN